MKKFSIIHTLIAMLIFTGSELRANDGKYVQAMQKHIESLYAAKSVQELQEVVNAFERIGNAEKTKWEPYYYAAFAHIMMASRDNDNAKKDAYLDMALSAIQKAKNLNAQESEVVALEGFATMMRVTVDPASRGPQYAGLAIQFFEKAIALSPDNPRPITLMAQMQFGTARFFGSAPTEACANIEKALEKFTTFKSDNPLAPAWGKGMAEGLKAQCK